MPAIIIIFHTPSNAGYAMTPLEKAFFQVGCQLYGDQSKVHFGFKNLDSGMPESLPDGFSNVIAIDTASTDISMLNSTKTYIQKNHITTALVFDLQVKSPICTMLRKAGISTIFSYWGAPISGINTGIKLLLKKLEVAIEKNKPNLFIFESKAMQNLAVNGRGILKKNTCVIPTGVDTDRFQPNPNAKTYIAKEFNIPINKKIAFYTGHMEKRKGVKIIMEAAIKLIDDYKLTNWHFLICGNRRDEERPYLEMIENSETLNHVTFAGYRSDIDLITPGCDLGIIASTGWDSFPMSSLEMAACGLPIIVSDLQGLTETITDGITGKSFEPGNSTQLARILLEFEQDEPMRQRYSHASRERILKQYSLSIQKDALLHNMNSTLKK